MNTTFIVTFAVGGALLLALVALVFARVMRRPLDIISRSAHEPSAVTRVLFPNWLFYLYISTSIIFALVEFLRSGTFDYPGTQSSVGASSFILGFAATVYYSSLLKRFPSDSNARSSVRLALLLAVILVIVSIYLSVVSAPRSELPEMGSELSSELSERR